LILNSYIVKGLRAACLALFSALVVIVFMQVVLRYFFASPLAWSDEMARLLLVWVSFLGITLVYFSEEGHPSVTVVVDRLSPRNQARLKLVLTLALCVTLFAGGVVSFNSTLRNHRFISPVLHFPNSLKYAVVPLSFFLMSYKSAYDLIQFFRPGRRKGEGAA
jgi:TRAP-type C4-dicarboxylate transport system permease small subunit